MTSPKSDPGEHNALPIGVFDSGLGGLTVAREIRRILPHEHLLYLGDNARVPYGTRSPATIERYAANCAEFLVYQGIKLLVVACNTVSAVALPYLREQMTVPVLGVIGAGARAACAATRTGRIGVIGTAGTVGSGAYPREIVAIAPDVVVHQRPAPLLVPLAEEGWLDGEVPRLAVRRYVEPLAEAGVDVLLLGCTHYPILEETIRQVLKELGSAATVINSAIVMGEEVSDALNAGGPAARTGAGGLRCCVTDLPDSFQVVASRFLGEPIADVEQVDIL